MTRVISATEAKKRLGQVVAWAVEEGEEVVIQARGKPKAVVISYETYREFRRLREVILPQLAAGLDHGALNLYNRAEQKTSMRSKMTLARL